MHTVYNIITAFCFFPFFKFLEKAAIWAIPDRNNDTKTVLLDERFDGETGGMSLEGYAGVNIGISYKF